VNCLHSPPPGSLRRVLAAGLAAWLAMAGLSVKAQEGDGRPASEWRIVPRISVGATYSDNVRLAPSGEAEGDMIFQVDPGISINKEGGRLRFRLEYTAQGLLYANNGDANTINNFLNTFGTAELYEDHLFLDAFGSISQSLTTSGGRADVGNRGLAGGGSSFASGLFNNVNLSVLPGANEIFNPTAIFSNIALSGDQTTSANFGVSPYWRQDFGGWADALVRYRYTDTAFEEDGFDGQINSVEFNLTSGRRFSVLTWSLRYFYQQQDNQQQQDDSQENNQGVVGDNRKERVEGQMNYRLNSTWTLTADAGYVDDQSTTISNIDNGSYWALGAIWSPNRIYSLGAAYGLNFNRVIARWTPSPRTNLLVSREYRGVGTSPGTYWNGTLNYRARYSTWSARYTQEVTTIQELLSNSLTGVGPDGQPVILDEDGQVVVPTGPFGLTNEQFLRKRFDANATYRRGRSALSFNLFSENREFQAPNPDENAYGLGGLWTWRFAPRTASFLGTGWERDDSGDDQQDDYWVSVVGLARVFTPDSGGLISYRYYQNDAESSDQGFRENRLNVRFSTKF